MGGKFCEEAFGNTHYWSAVLIQSANGVREKRSPVRLIPLGRREVLVVGGKHSKKSPCAREMSVDRFPART